MSHLAVAQRERIPDGTVDAQSISLDFQRRRGEMTADVEQLRRSQIRVDLIERSLQVVRLFLSNDQTNRRKLIHLRCCSIHFHYLRDRGSARASLPPANTPSTSVMRWRGSHNMLASVGALRILYRSPG